MRVSVHLAPYDVAPFDVAPSGWDRGDLSRGVCSVTGWSIDGAAVEVRQNLAP